MISRRRFNGLLGAGLAFAAQPSRAAAGSFLACYRGKADDFGVALIDADGLVLERFPIPGRGHGIAVAPDGGHAIVFARRPGRFARIIDLKRRRIAGDITADPARHFYGHAVFSKDGKTLYATENDFDAERGIIGLYDATKGFARIGEYETHGIGPHQLLLDPAGETLIIANGGIATHPDYPRQKLNIASMQPSLVYLDAPTGNLMEQVALPEHLHQLSLRHLTQGADGVVWIGGQYEGPATDVPPLVWSHRRGEDLKPCPGSADPDLRNYVGSIEAVSGGRQVVATAPRGDVAMTVDGRTGSVLEKCAMVDVSGVAPQGMGYRLFSGTGATWSDALSKTDLHFDNHAVALL